MRSALLVLLLCTLRCFAQETVGGLPFSMLMGWDNSIVAAVATSAFDAEEVKAEDGARDRSGVMALYARFLAVDADLRSAGVWSTLSNGDRVWRLRIVSRGALALELFCQDFSLPDGATLHVYDDHGEQVHGGYTGANRQSDGSFSAHMVHGDALMIEYYEPVAVRNAGYFRITQVLHAYRFVGAERLKASDPCQVDVACSEGSGWESQRDAVVRIRVVIPQGAGFCTGTLMNNTAQDCRPFILTALHCAIGSSTANFNQYQFRFGYQRSACATGTVTTNNTITGCVKRADSNDGGGTNGSDFLLLELNQPIPAVYMPFYAGWNATNTASPNGRSIHHPSADIKKISTYGSSLSTAGWGIVGSHWRVTWVPTTNGHGVTEEGSSGSPIFDPSRRVVGTLTGGGSCCTANVCGTGTGPFVSDYYGKMSYHWTQNPNQAGQKLKQWLDPMNYQTLVLDGSYDPCATIGIDEVREAGGTRVYPNPAKDLITIKYPEGVVIADLLEVTDLSGRTVHRSRPVTVGESILDGSSWSTGTYLVTLVANGVRHRGGRVTIGMR